jgi:hypothetical protein
MPEWLSGRTIRRRFPKIRNIKVTDEALDKVLLAIAEKVEAACKDFRVGLESAHDPIARQWWTPTDLLARIGRIIAHTARDPVAQTFGVALYGSIHLLGIKGTTKLILDMRRKHAGTKSKGSKAPVPGVRTGSDPQS